MLLRLWTPLMALLLLVACSGEKSGTNENAQRSCAGVNGCDTSEEAMTARAEMLAAQQEAQQLAERQKRNDAKAAARDQMNRKP